jgi:Na+/melibiose symporter-like transporter
MRTPEADRRARTNARAFLLVGSATMSAAVTFTPLVNWIITGGPGLRVAALQLLVGVVMMVIGGVLAALDLRRLRREEAEPPALPELNRRDLWALGLPWVTAEGVSEWAPKDWAYETDPETVAERETPDERVHRQLHERRRAVQFGCSLCGGPHLAAKCPYRMSS